MGTLFSTFILVGVVLVFYFRWKSVEKHKAVDKARLEAREQTLMCVGHELRTPLLTVSLALEEIQAVAPESESELMENVKLIRQAVDLMLELICNILDSNKLAAGKMKLHCEPFALPAFAEDVKRIMAPIVRKNANVEFVTRVSQSVVGTMCKKSHECVCVFLKNFHIDLDRARLMQVVINLLSNSFKVR